MYKIHKNGNNFYKIIKKKDVENYPDVDAG